MRVDFISSVLGDPVTITEIIQPYFYTFCKTLVYIVYKIGWRLKIRGKKNIFKKGAVIIAPNHRSFADPPLVGVSLRRPVHFLAKEELFKFRPFGWLIGMLNAHPLKRSGDIAAVRLAKKILEEGSALIIFPEGTRSKTDDFGKAKPGVGVLSKMTGAPVLPVYIHNSGHMKQMKRLEVRFGAPLWPDAFETPLELAEETMRQIRLLREKI